MRTRNVSGRTPIKDLSLATKSVSQQLRRKNRMDEGCLAEEIEVLEAIYIHELEVERDNNGGVEKIRLQLHPATGDDVDQQFVCMTLILDLPKTYPEQPPDITIKNPRGIGEEEVQSLTEAMHKLSEDRTGGPMLYELIELAKDSLTLGNIPRCACMICLEHFVEGDCFTRTDCYHYFHESCLARYTRHSASTQPEVESTYARHTKAEEQKLVCPVCREVIQNRSDDLATVQDEDGVDFQPSEELRAMQKEMAAIFERQKAKGGIIDLEAERNKYLIKEDDVVHLHTVSSDPNLQSKDEASSTRSGRNDLDRPGSGRDARQKNSPRPSDKYDRGKGRPDSGYQRDRRKDDRRNHDRGNDRPDSGYQRDRRKENSDYDRGKGRHDSGYQRDRRRENDDRGKGREKSDYVRGKDRGDRFDNKPHSDDEAVRKNLKNRDRNRGDRDNDLRREQRLDEDWRGNRRDDKLKQESDKLTKGSSKDVEKDLKSEVKSDETKKEEISSAQDKVSEKPCTEVEQCKGVDVKADQRDKSARNDEEKHESRNESKSSATYQSENPLSKDSHSNKKHEPHSDKKHESDKKSTQGKSSNSSRNNEDRERYRQDNWRDRRETGTAGNRPNSSRQSDRRHDRNDDRNKRNYRDQDLTKTDDRPQHRGNDRAYREGGSNNRGRDSNYKDRDGNYKGGDRKYEGGERNDKVTDSSYRASESKYKSDERSYDGSDKKYQRNNRDRQDFRDRDFAQRDERQQQRNDRREKNKGSDTEVLKDVDHGPKSGSKVSENDCDKNSGVASGGVKGVIEDNETRDGSTSDRVGSSAGRRRGRGRGRGFRGRPAADEDRRDEHTFKSSEADRVEKDFRSLKIDKAESKKESNNKVESKRDTNTECNNLHEKGSGNHSTGAGSERGGLSDKKGVDRVKGPPGFKTRPPPGFQNDPMGVGQPPPGF